MLEVASESTASIDTGAKRDDCATLAIPEYWRFDKTGQYHGAKLASDRLVEGHYEPIPLEKPQTEKKYELRLILLDCRPEA